MWVAVRVPTWGGSKLARSAGESAASSVVVMPCTWVAESAPMEVASSEARLVVEIARASWGERGEISVVAVSVKEEAARPGSWGAGCAPMWVAVGAARGGAGNARRRGRGGGP